MITPDEIKIGIMPATIHRKGRIGIVSRSGTLTYEAVGQVTEMAWASPLRWASAETRSTASSTSMFSRVFNDDPNTDAVIMIGEIGGPDEVNAAQWARTT